MASPKGPTCWFAQFSATPCEGQLRRCHLLSQQRLRQEYPSGALWLSDREKALSRRSYERDGLAVIHEAQEDGPTIVRRMSLRELQEDSRLWRPGCGGIAGVSAHHGQFDGYELRVPFAKIPAETIAFVDELRLMAFLESDRRYRHAEAA